MQPQTNHQSGEAVYDFAPVDFDIETVPPRCNPGRFQATMNVSSKPNKDKLPMLVIEWTLDAVADDNSENEQFVGSTLTDYMVLRTEGDPKGRMTKLRLRELLGRVQLGYEMVPKQIRNKTDLDELCAAMSGQSVEIGISTRVDQIGEARENFIYRAPAGAQVDGGGDDEHAAPARSAPRAAAAAAKKPAPKVQSRRR